MLHVTKCVVYNSWREPEFHSLTRKPIVTEYGDPMIRRFLALTLFTLAAVLTHAQPSLPSSFQAKTIHSPEGADIFVRWGGQRPRSTPNSWVRGEQRFVGSSGR